MIGVQRKHLLVFMFGLFTAITLTHEGYPYDQMYGNVGYKLSNPLVGEDGRIYTCSRKVAFAFESNGTVSWAILLNYTCHPEIAPVQDETGKVWYEIKFANTDFRFLYVCMETNIFVGQIYLVAENRVLRLSPSNIGSNEPTSDVLFGPEAVGERWGEVVGISISIWSYSLFITVKNRGLLAYSLHGRLLWSATPALYKSGYHQGCKRNVEDCFFVSSPVIDHCYGSIHVVNSEGQLYSLSAQTPDFNWVQDFSGVDKDFTVVAGNNGRLYLVFPRRSIVMALNSTSGSVLWQKSVGPLSSLQNSPVVDVNGWVSIGSLDGSLYSFSLSGDGKKYIKGGESNLIQVSPLLDCSGTSIYVSQTTVEGKITHVIGEFLYISAIKSLDVEFTMLADSTGAVHWHTSYPGQFSSLLFDSELRHFTLDERALLAFVAASNFGKHMPCHSIEERLAWSCSQSKPRTDNIYIGSGRTIFFFSIFQFGILVALAWIVRFCYIFWSKRKLKEQDLQMFLEIRRSLHQRKKEFTRMISELEKKAAGDGKAVSDGIKAEIEDMVKEKEGIEQKLSTTYSLGRDSAPAGGQLLPLYNGHSFQSSTKESVTLFHTVSSDASPSSSPVEASDDGSSWSSWSGGEEEVDKEMMISSSGKGKGPLVGGGSGSPLMASGGSASKDYVNPLFGGKRGVVEFGGWGGSEIEEEGLEGSHERVEFKK